QSDAGSRGSAAALRDNGRDHLAADPADVGGAVLLLEVQSDGTVLHAEIEVVPRGVPGRDELLIVDYVAARALLNPRRNLAHEIDHPDRQRCRVRALGLMRFHISARGTVKTFARDTRV